uniref:Fucolectin tachylectin-4 pentraxin-1 domain-containing protein n=1 Tax=Pygocentrus nattereri TaxID=42514 RepID=A0AAR2KML6_PYGNA
SLINTLLLNTLFLICSLNRVAVIHSLQTGATSTFSFSAAEGQFINILLPGGGKILTLCEVEVWADDQLRPHPHENIAAGAKAAQSSTQEHQGNAQNAVDGNNNTDYRRGSCTLSKFEAEPWWRVELPGVCNVTSVTITNRGDCCGHRINGAQIRIGNSLKNNGNNNKLVAVIGPLGSEVTKTYRFRATEGRYVNIFLPGENKILTLCEVEVFADEEFRPESLYLHDQTELQNLALRGTATQSSLHSSSTLAAFGLAQNAIDGNRNSHLKRGSCMQTGKESAPWWRVILHHKSMIFSVALTNRGDCCSEDLDGAEIRIGDSVKNNGKDNPLCATVSSIPAGQTEYFNCSALLEGSYVTVSLPREGTLSLCEVEVFGVPVVRCGD